MINITSNVTGNKFYLSTEQIVFVQYATGSEHSTRWGFH